jgi:hypothetical protein
VLPPPQKYKCQSIITEENLAEPFLISIAEGIADLFRGGAVSNLIKEAIQRRGSPRSFAAQRRLLRMTIGPYRCRARSGLQSYCRTRAQSVILVDEFGEGFLDSFFKAQGSRKSSTRRYARYRTEVPVIVKVLGPDGYVRIHGRCFEIAEAGLGAVITSELVAGEMVTLEFSIPDSPEPFIMRSVVRHRMGFLHGFEFIGATPKQNELILQFCQKLEPS